MEVGKKRDAETMEGKKEDGGEKGEGDGSLVKKLSSGKGKRSPAPSTPKKTMKTAGGQNKSAAPAKSKAAKKVGDMAEETYDDEVFNLPKLMRLESNHVSKLTDEQMKRYEFYRRSDLRKEKVKKLLSSYNFIPPATSPSDSFIIAVKGLAKVFVGEVVENALEVQEQWKESGPLQPKHVREAYRRMMRDGLIPVVRSTPTYPLSLS